MTSPLSPEELQQLALMDWGRRRPLPAALWERLAAAGLYDWAVAEQRRVFGDSAAPAVPSFEALIQPPQRAQLTLVEQQAPTPGPTALSTRSKNRGRRAVKALAARRTGQQALAFSPRDFVMFSLPHKRMASNVFERRNGNYRFRIETGGGHVVPFGQDRLVPLWLATAFKAAGQPADNRIRFRAASDFLAAFQIAVDGGSTRTLMERFERWCNTKLTVFDESVSGRLLFRHYHLIDAGQLWYQRQGNTNQYTLWQNVLELHPKFADDLRSSTIPVDFETVVALRDMPGALDLYIWQAHRSWELANHGATRPVAVPLALLRAQLGSQSPERKAKQLIKRWQGVVKELWPRCPNFFDPTRDMFFLQPGKAVFERTATKLPGVVPEPPIPLRAPEGPSRPEEGLILKRPST